ncbi:MAG TPA: NAD(P)/FAD-dependent oxidoreductase, partial [Planctomycetota bacterium]|nr:NAD(P)/FAD-dependent oxidoreductase [Planctomycetota bacterium]
MKVEQRDVDVVIAGAGPAGAGLALRLAGQGYSVALVDKARFPREKPCGEFLSPPCVPMLAELGIDVFALGAASGHEVRGMRLAVGDHSAVGRYASIGRAHAPQIGGIGVRREVLDAELVALARRHPDILVLEEHGVRDLIRDADGRVRGLLLDEPDGSQRPLRAAVTVGADGLRSRVARSLGVQRPIPWLQRFALVTRFRGVEAQDFGELHFFDRGYFAAVDVDSGLFSLNLIVDAAALPKGRDEVERFFESRLDLVPRLRERLRCAERAAPLRAYGPLGVRTVRQVMPGVALVGDACGYVDPMTGEGIYLALRGAELLAGAIHERFVSGDEARAWRTYDRARKREIAPKLAMSRLLQRAIRRPRLVERFG